MKKILFLLFALFAISCKSQTVSLETTAQCMGNPNCPDFTYVKDINNSLDKYVGIWTGTYNGMVYELKFNKSLYQDFMGFKRDQITGRLRITSPPSNGFPHLVIFDNFNESDDEKTQFSGLNFQRNLQSYRVSFVGPSPKGCINYGDLYLTVKPNTPNQMQIFYWSDKDIVTGNCPNSFQQTFPEKQSITLIKQ